MALLKRACLLLSVILLSACGDSDNVEPPAALTDFKHSHFFDLEWTSLTDDEIGDQFVYIQPLKLQSSIVTAGREGVINRYDLEDGSELAEIELDTILSGGVGGNESVWLVGTRQGQVIAIDAASESVRWRARVPSEVLARPLVHDDKVIVRTVDGQILALGTDDGEIEWSWAHTIPALTLRGISEPIMTRDRIFAGLENGRLVALSPEDGEAGWDVAIANPSGRSEVQRLVDIDGHGALYGTVLYVTSYQGRMAAIDVSRGQFLWARDFSSHTGISLNSDAVYSADDQSHIWALDRNNGATLWKQDKLQARDVTRPVIYKDFLVVGDFEGYLHVLSRFDGRFVARALVGESGILVPPIIDGDRILVLTRRGVLSSYELKPIVPLDDAIFE